MNGRPAPPEAAGAGIEGPGGEVIFGHDRPAPNVHIEPRMPAAERDRNRAEAERRAEARARLFAVIPDDVLTALAAALREAREEGRRGR